MKQEFRVWIAKGRVGVCPHCNRAGVRYEAMRGLWRCRSFDCGYFPTDTELQLMRWLPDELPQRSVREDDDAAVSVRSIPTVPVVTYCTGAYECFPTMSGTIAPYEDIPTVPAVMSYSGYYHLNLAMVNTAIVRYEDIPSLDVKEPPAPPTQCSFCGEKPEYSYLTRCHYCGRALCCHCMTVVREGDEFRDACPECAKGRGIAETQGQVLAKARGGLWVGNWIAAVLSVGMLIAVALSTISAGIAVLVVLVAMLCAMGILAMDSWLKKR